MSQPPSEESTSTPSREVHSSAHQLEELPGQIGELLMRMSRTQMATKLYAPTNAMRSKAFDSLHEAFCEILELLDPLLVRFEPDRVTWEHHAVYDATEFDNNFAQFLYRDGVRQLAFTGGLERDELEQFVALLRPSPDADRDLVDTLWEAGFEHIAHVAVDGFTEAFEDEDDENDDDYSPAVPRFHRLIEILTGIGDPVAVVPQQDTTRVDLDHPAAAALMERVRQGRPEAGGWGADLDVISLRQLIQTVEDFVVQVLSSSASGFSLSEIADLCGGLFLQRITRGQFAETSGLLHRIAPSGSRSPEHAVLVSEVADRAGSAELLDMVLAQGGPLTHESVAEAASDYFRQHGQLTDADLADRGAQIHVGPAQTLLASLTAERMLFQPDYWATQVEGLSAPMLEVILERLASRSQHPDSVNAIFEAAMAHETPSVVARAIELIPREYDDRLREVCLREYLSPHLDVRCAALKRMGQSQDPSLGIYLLNRARKEGLMSFKRRELELLLFGLVAIGGDRYLPFLRRQLEGFGVVKGALLLNRDLKTLLRLNDEVVVLLSAIAQINSPAAVDLVREVRGSARGKLRDLCDELWRRMVSNYSETAREESGTYAAPVDAEVDRPAWEETSAVFEPVDSSSLAAVQGPQDDEWVELKKILDQPVSSPRIASPEEAPAWVLADTGGLFGRIGTAPNPAAIPDTVGPADSGPGPEEPLTALLEEMEPAATPDPEGDFNRQAAPASGVFKRAASGTQSTPSARKPSKKAPPSGILRRPSSKKKRTPLKILEDIQGGGGDREA